MVPRPKLLGGGTQSRSATKSLEIVPDSPFVVFYGHNPEANPIELTGNVVLTSSETLNIKKVTIQLEGTQKLTWITNTVNPQAFTEKKTFHNEDCTLFPPDASMAGNTHTIKSGTQKWPFRFTLPTTLPESVEGMQGTYVIYNLNAIVTRGFGSRPLTDTKRIRLVRTLGNDSLDSINLEQINEDVWANKISYRITVPRVNYIYGTQITADFILTPIRKGVTIGKVKLELLETTQVGYTSGDRLIRNRHEQIVCQTEGSKPEDCKVLVTNFHPESLCDESYHFQMTLPLERSLKKCRQTFDGDGLKIEHRLRIYVSLHNPEGHTSQLLVKNMVNLFLSPRLPVGEDNCVSVSPTQIAALHEAAHHNLTAPPSYESHQLDLLYDEIDRSGLITPAPWASAPNSGLNTPFYTLSQNPSHENISSMDAVAHSDGRTNGDMNGASASQLHTRLANLQEQGSSHWARTQAADRFSGSATPLRQSAQDESPTATEPTSHHSSAVPSRNVSGYFPPSSTSPTPGTLEFNMEELARTPSYNTAVRAPISTHPSQVGLPSYAAAISRQPSPGTSPPQQPTVPERSSIDRTSLEAAPYMRGGRSNSAATRSSTDTDESLMLAPPAPVALATGSAIRETSRPRGSSLRHSMSSEIEQERDPSRTRRPEAVHWAIS